MDVEKLLTNSIQDGIREGIKSRLGGYNTPLDKLLADILKEQDAAFREMLGGAIESAIGDESFREEIRAQVRHKLATLLVARFGGELEKQVNSLKSDPTTRARITLALDEIMKGRPTA